MRAVFGEERAVAGRNDVRALRYGEQAVGFVHLADAARYAAVFRERVQQLVADHAVFAGLRLA